MRKLRSGEATFGPAFSDKGVVVFRGTEALQGVAPKADAGVGRLDKESAILGGQHNAIVRKEGKLFASEKARQGRFALAGLAEKHCGTRRKGDGAAVKDVSALATENEREDLVEKDLANSFIGYTRMRLACDLIAVRRYREGADIRIGENVALALA